MEVSDGILVLVPEGLEFTITNTEDEQLEIYVVSEKVAAGFTPKAGKRPRGNPW